MTPKKVMQVKLSIRKFLFIPVIFVLAFSACKNEKSADESANGVKSKDSFAKLNEDIAANPNRADLLYQRAKIFIQRDVMNQAFEDLSRATAIDSTNTEYLMLLADVAFKTFQIKRASDSFEKVVKLDPQNKDAYLKLSELYFYVKGYQKSLLYSNEALKLDKNLVRAYYLRGFAYKEMGDTGKAVSSFNTVIDLQPDYDAFIQLGNIYAARNNPLAVQYYNNALKVEVNSTEALYNRGLFFQNAGEIGKAVADYNAIIKIDPNYSDAYFNLGYINSVLSSNWNEAIRFYTEAIKVNDQYAEAFFNRGVCYEKIGNKEAAQKDFITTLDIAPGYKPAAEKLKR
jgi:tetratricopeptide (TPR) repeat protein